MTQTPALEPGPIEYEINTIADFQKVPDDRLGDCLLEFAGSMLELRKLTKHGIVTNGWTWVDDGIHLFRGATLQIGEESEYIKNPNFPEVQP